MNTILRRFFSGIFLLITISTFAQTSTNSPYSRYGLGELQTSGFAQQNAMGTAGFALQNDSATPHFINPINPASYSSLKLTTIEIGAFDTYSVLQNKTQGTSSNKAGLAYFALGIPLTQPGKPFSWGTGLGIVPFSNVGYDISNQSTIDSIGQVNYSYEGKGGINELFWSHGFSYKGISMGINASYLFGNMSFISRDSFADLLNAFGSRYTKQIQYNDLYFKTGLQYKVKLDSNYTLGFGFTMNLPASINANTTTLGQTITYKGTTEINNDTVLYSPDVKSTYKLPAMYGFGFMFLIKDKLTITADYGIQNWTNFDTSQNNKGLFGNSNKVALGFQFYNKSLTDKSSYIKRMSYRFGAFFGNSYLQLKGPEPITDMGFTVGFGFPLRSSKSGEDVRKGHVNLSLIAGQRGTIENNLVKENYFRFVIGFTLNEKWFNRYKYN